MKLSLCVRSSLPRVGMAEPLAPSDDAPPDIRVLQVEVSPRPQSSSSKGWLQIRLPRTDDPGTTS